MNNQDFILQLPTECQTVAIAPRHKMTLQHFAVGQDVWVVLLTTMPGDSSKAWRLSRGEYWRIQPKHEYRDRWIRENLPPTIEADRNPPKRRFTQLCLLF